MEHLGQKLSIVGKDGKSHVAHIWFIGYGDARYLKETKNAEIWSK
jgi:hypothetical protein